MVLFLLHHPKDIVPLERPHQLRLEGRALPRELWLFLEAGVGRGYKQRSLIRPV